MAQSQLKLNGKVAIITGSSDGIGAGIAIEYSKEGALLVVNGRDTEKLQIVAGKCEAVSPAKSKPLMMTGDVTDEKFRNDLIVKTIEKFGRLDILINNAGYFKASPIDSPDMQPLNAMLDIHVRAPYHLTKLAIPHLIKSKGVVINISSVAGIRPCVPGPTVEYSMAKAALDQFSQWLARELGPHGVRANSINPGVVRSNIVQASTGIPPEAVKMFYEASAPTHALQRIGEPNEIGRVAVFLGSDDSSFVTGNIMRADGGVLVMPAGPFQKA